jgi:hypothetical protein
MNSSKENDYEKNIREIFSEDIENIASKFMKDILSGKPFNEEEMKSQMKHEFDKLKFSAIREIKNRKNGKIDF